MNEEYQKVKKENKELTKDNSSAKTHFSKEIQLITSNFTKKFSLIKQILTKKDLKLTASLNYVQKLKS